MSSSASVLLSRLSRPERTVSGAPMSWVAWRSAMNARSRSEYWWAAASSGAGILPGRPWRSRRKDSADEPARKRARSSVSAQITPVATIAYGWPSVADGRNDSRYRASAGSVLCGMKWCANANGRPSAPATCAL